MTTVDILFGVGLLANIVKGGDLVLNKRQRRVLQERFEAFTLWLDDLRPISWFASLSRPKPAFWWSVSAAVFALVAGPRVTGGALAFLLDFIRDSGIALKTGLAGSGKGPAITAATSIRVGILTAIPVSYFIIRKVYHRLIAWLVGSARFWPFFGRLLLFYLFSVCVLAAFWGLCLLARGSLVPTVLALLVLPTTFSVYFLNTIGWLMVTLYIVLRVANLTVRTVGVICWRIVEYSQGVFAALMLAATVALGLVRVFIDRK